MWSTSKVNILKNISVVIPSMVTFRRLWLEDNQHSIPYRELLPATPTQLDMLTNIFT